MPKVNYIDSSIAIKYADVFQNYARKKLTGNIEKTAKTYYDMKNKVDKYEQNLDKLNKSLKVNDSESDRKKKTALENKINNLKLELKNYLDDHPELNKTGNRSLFLASTYKKKIKEIKNKETVEISDINKLSAALGYVNSIINSDKPDYINESYTTGKKVALLFENITKKDQQKLNEAINNYSNDCCTLNSLMEIEADPEPENPKEIKNVYSDVKILEKRLLDLDNNYHVNSREFKAMKKALKDVISVASSNIINKIELGNKVEILQRAAVNYINEKGIGGQQTDLGKNRFDLAVDVANFAFDCGEDYPSFDSYERYYDTHHKATEDNYEFNRANYLSGKKQDVLIFKSDDKTKCDEDLKKYQIEYHIRGEENDNSVVVLDEDSEIEFEI